MKTVKFRVVSVILVLMTVSVLFAGCAANNYKKGINVIEAGSLATLLSDSQVVVVDARSPEDYAKGHVKGAICLAPSELTISDPVPGLIAPKETVESVLSAKGISNQSRVLIYDNNGGVNASRVWWVLKVYGHENAAVVNDGEDALVAAKLPLTADVTELPKTEYVAKEQNKMMIASIDEVKAAIDGTKPAIILDVRSQAEYDEGAIPNAILYPHTKNLFEDGTFRPSSHIILNYKDLGIKQDSAVILYCKTSFRATQTAMLLNEAGFTNVKVYDGAWVEWSAKETPVEAAPDETTTEVKPSQSDAS